MRLFSHGVLLSEFFSCFFELIRSKLELTGNVVLHWVFRVRARDQLNQHLYDEVRVQSRNPTVLDSLLADLTSVSLDVGVIDFCHEEDLRTFEWVIVTEVDIDCEFASLIRSVLGAVNDNVPLGDLVINKLDLNPWNWVIIEVHHLL